MTHSQTRLEEIWPDTYLISTYYEDRGLAFNQYVVDAAEPLLVHTGAADMIEDVVAGVERVLPVEELSYALAAHFESDECGALTALRERNPALRPVGSEITARQLDGFGIHENALVRTGGEELDLGDRTLELIDYPAEMHLWNGLLAYDPEHGGLFSADVFRRRGTVEELVVREQLDVSEIPVDRCPAADPRATLADRLADLDPNYVAPGHGPVIDRTQ
jgi:flavorubredoxin